MMMIGRGCLLQDVCLEIGFLSGRHGGGARSELPERSAVGEHWARVYVGTRVSRLLVTVFLGHCEASEGV